MSLAWIDASAGASGDMLLGALLDAGASLDAVRAAVAAVGVEPVDLSVEPVPRAGLRALRAHVTVPDTAVHRAWADIRQLLTDADLHPHVRTPAIAAFTRLAEAEAHVHGIDADDVHFHEVGALDAIADVVGACAAVHDLRIDAVTCSTVAVGSGSVASEHGRLPVPVPAVVELLARAGLPSSAGPVPHEACTPTGAALLATLATAAGPQPAMVVRRSGIGAGQRDTPGGANVLRVIVGDPAADETADRDGDPAADHAGWDTSTEVIVETNVDDLDPRLWPGVLDALLRAGAADAWLTPILMKKGRPAHTLHALCPPERVADVRGLIAERTTAIGLREYAVDKRALPREVRTVRVRGQEVRVKQARLAGTVVNVQPEYDDVAAAAAALGLPAKAVLAEAVASALETGDRGSTGVTGGTGPADPGR